jgi:tetratricopeptide (TPR) repeat protein
MSESNTLGNEHYKKATDLTKQNNWSWFTNFFKDDKTDIAIENYEKAYNNYKIARNYEKAGECQQHLVPLYNKNSYNFYNVGMAYLKSAEMYRFVDVKKSVNMLDESTNVFKENGKFVNVASNYKLLGDIQKSVNNHQDAISAYLKSYEYYDVEKHQSNAYDSLKDAICLMLEINEFDKVAGHLEKMIKYKLSLYYGFDYKKYCFDMLLIQLWAGDVVQFKRLLNIYTTSKNEFIKTNEYKCLNQLLDGYVQCDYDIFADAMLNYSNMHPLNNWQKKLLEFVGNKIGNDEWEEKDDGDLR